MEQASFFKGLKVLELASVLAGPAVGMFFAELGAEVIKIENARTGGDVTRRWKLPAEDKERAYSAYYCSVNYHKQLRFLDLGTDDGREEVYEIAKDADIVITNFKPSSAERMGMSFSHFKRINPQIIYAELTGFGYEESLPAFDVVLQAEAGFLFMSGEPGRAPVKMPVALIDILAAHQLKEAILMALLRRGQSGEGAYVSTSLLESAVASLANQATNWLMESHIPVPMGCQHPNIAPYGDIFYTKDEKPLVIAAGTEKQYAALCEALGLAELIEDERFKTNLLRVRNRTALYEALQPSFQARTRADCLALLHQYNVPVGSIRNMQEVFERPLANGMILEDQLPDGSVGRRVRTVAFEFREE
jgi:crotonobetainyl-CoA:carnitine CoA-transferase CaiB-like acyl-CoA transferase